MLQLETGPIDAVVGALGPSRHFLSSGTASPMSQDPSVPGARAMPAWLCCTAQVGKHVLILALPRDTGSMERNCKKEILLVPQNFSSQRNSLACPVDQSL